MWIVRIALERPYTFIVLALAILIIGPLAIFRTPTDIFPNIRIPVVSIIWSFNGLPPDEMASRIVSSFERGITTTVTDVEHIESNSLNGVAVIKVFFQPTVNVELAISQITAISQAFLRSLPPSTTPPLILSYNASTVPVIQLALSSDTLPEQQLNDLGFNFIRTQLATVPGAASPYPYGGKQRQINVDLNTQAMQTYGVTPQMVSAAIGNQNLLLPSGTEKIGPFEYYIKMNASPTVAEELNNLPVKQQEDSILYIRDVAHVRDGFSPQTNIVRIDGKRAVLMTIQKIGQASTLDIVNGVKNLLPTIRAGVPPELTVTPLGDQSIFVKGAVNGVLKEGAIAAVLTSLMILLFLGSWRSTMAIILSIPLAILSSLIMLSVLGETINIMTLGGLALAVGILVDDATVTIENINTHLENKKENEDQDEAQDDPLLKDPVKRAILNGAQEIAVPALVSTLSICIVFVPMFFLTGVAKYLFVPLAEAVVFAMIASYILSRTLVPTLAMYLLKEHEETSQKQSFFGRIQASFNTRFERMRDGYHDLLGNGFESSRLVILGFLGFALVTALLLTPWLGSDFFPTTDAGQIKLHYRAQSGTRIEETARLNDQVDEIIRKVIPADQLDSITDNIGLPNSGINLSYSNSAPVGPGDSDILIQLKPDHDLLESYIKTLRKELHNRLPGLTYAFLPADIVSQILNFGLPAPIDVQIIGKDKEGNRKLAEQMLKKIALVPGVVDSRIQQEDNYPEMRLTVDRSKAQSLGITQNDIARNLLLSLSGSFQTAPAFWLDRKIGVSYSVVTSMPQYRLQSLEDLKNIPVAVSTGNVQPIIGSLGELSRGVGPTVISHFNVQETLDIYAGVESRDLGAVSKDIRAVVKEFGNQKPKDTRIVIRGQTLTQQQSFRGLYYGLIFSIVLVYLLIVVNFQSWIDPLIIISALPVALAGIIWMLFVTGTTLSVPALTGAIMCIGVATANSILVVSFAREQMAEGRDPKDAAHQAGFARLRPVLMTALAMIIGMVPMALGLGEGGEQNAPLGRAVIGGLLFSTGATLFFVPVMFKVVHNRLAARRNNSDDKGTANHV